MGEWVASVIIITHAAATRCGRSARRTSELRRPNETKRDSSQGATQSASSSFYLRSMPTRGEPKYTERVRASAHEKRKRKKRIEKYNIKYKQNNINNNNSSSRSSNCNVQLMSGRGEGESARERASKRAIAREKERAKRV